MISNEAPPTPALPSGASALTPTPIKPGAPFGFQVALVFPLPSVFEAAGVSPVGLVFTVTCASDTGEPFLVTEISTTCSWLAFSFACFALTSTLSCSPVVEDDVRAVVPVLLELLELLDVLLVLALLLVEGGLDAATVCVEPDELATATT